MDPTKQPEQIHNYGARFPGLEMTRAGAKKKAAKKKFKALAKLKDAAA
jgi:hypothetical protein